MTGVQTCALPIWTMFFEIERILKEKMDAGKAAKGFLLENVEGLVNHDAVIH